MKPITSFLAFSLLAALPVLAQPRFTGQVGGGFSEPLNPIGTRLDRGFNITAGAGISGKTLGALVNFHYNDFGINQTALANVGAPDGTTRIWAFTLDPIVHLSPRPEGPVDFYITGGGGVYHRTVEFTQPTLTTFTAFDPWFGFYPATVATNQILASYAVTKPGVDGGVGMSFKIGKGSLKAFAEARYHHMFMSRGPDTSFIPVTFGIRW
jgi:hypothetical protein